MVSSLKCKLLEDKVFLFISVAPELNTVPRTEQVFVRVLNE
jgi:hypothetical protein